jgi:dimethylglycine catabolism A
VNSLALQPLRIGSVELRNRVAQSATVNNLGRNLAITHEQIAFYSERAMGGVGAIVTEGLSVHPTSIPNSTVPLAYDKRLVEGFARLASAVHDGGSAIFGQLWHVGRQALWNPALVPWAPSGRRDPYSGTTPHVMTDAEILDVIEGFAAATANLRRAGFDGVELHAAHGYLIAQFLSPLSNQRDDRWGGSPQNRARFAVELIRACRAAAGESFVVGVKLSVHEYVDGGLTLEDAQLIAQYLAGAAPPDYFATGQGNFSPSLEKHVPDMHFGDRPFAHLARGIREAAGGVPVMAISKIPDLATASALLAEGVADLVGMSRALLADAHLVRKAAAGQTPRPCVYCNVCWEYIHGGRPVACLYAPETGRESEVETAPPPAARRRIHVIGGGPAGLEFSRVALQYGHHVHIHEGSAVLGGRLRAEARVPGQEVYHAAADWLEGEVRRLGAEISTGLEIGLSEAGNLAGDLTVIATGAVPAVEGLPGISDVIPLDGLLERPAASLADPVVIVDEIEAEPVYGVAVELARRGLRVSIVTRRAAIGRRVAYISMIGVFRRLDEAGVRMHPLAVPVRVMDGEMIVAHPFSGQESRLGPVGTVVRAGPYQSPIPDLASHDLVIGDASSPREILPVVREANVTAQRIFGASR